MGKYSFFRIFLGMDNGFRPKFLKTYANLSEVIVGAISDYDSEVKAGDFPAKEHSFT